MAAAIDLAPACPVIEHFRDIIYDEAGSILEIYSYLIYDFGADVIARAYLDMPDKVALMRPVPVPDAVLDYLKERFWQIDRLGARGYETIWQMTWNT